MCVSVCLQAVLPVQGAHFLFNSAFVQHDQQKGQMTMYVTGMQPGYSCMQVINAHPCMSICFYPHLLMTYYR